VAAKSHQLSYSTGAPLVTRMAKFWEGKLEGRVSSFIMKFLQMRGILTERFSNIYIYIYIF
jgi:hypothetical protein